MDGDDGRSRLGGPEALPAARPPRAVIMVAGVFARGIRPCGHAAFSTIMANLREPLVEEGYHVELWGYNNIPPTIDGDSVPEDGGRRCFPAFAHYESHLQGAIDRMPCVKHRDKWFRSQVFSAEWARQQGAYQNVLRLDFLFRRAMRKLADAVRGGLLRAEDMVVVALPEMVLLPYDAAPLHYLRHNNALLSLAGTDGLLAGRAGLVLRWFGNVNAVTALQADCYEQWWAAGFDGMERVDWRTARALRVAPDGRFWHPAFGPAPSVRAHPGGTRKYMGDLARRLVAAPGVPARREELADIGIRDERVATGAICELQEAVGDGHHAVVGKLYRWALGCLRGSRPRLLGCYQDRAQTLLMAAVFRRLSTVRPGQESSAQKASALARWMCFRPLQAT